ncbi:MAG: rRNA (guanine527-N7)-methyltransferase [Solirubrobacteraceae bacterium]|nr:rRNA (guanine527-N7)-methyltransferase [Solirubrobacteraceae bacterium]
MSGADGRVAARLGELCRRYALSAAQGGQLRCLLEVLASDPHAPTSVTTPREALDIHVADSLAALELELVRTAETIADIGSGPGFPGLALAVARPTARVALIESAARKCLFIERARSAGGVGNATVVGCRAEAWAEGQGEQDVVTARAVAPLAVLCEYGAPLLREGGVLVAWRGRRDRAEEAAAARACDELGLEPQSPVRSEPYAGSVAHHLHVYLKVMPTPPRFPRRPGIASKRPLGGST